MAAAHPEHGQTEFLLHPTHAWKLVPATPLPEAEVLPRIQEIYRLNAERNEERKRAFEAYCAEKKRVAAEDAAGRADHDRGQREILADARERMRPDVAGADDAGAVAAIFDADPGQRFAVVGIIPAPEPSTDVIVCVFAAFPSVADARRYAEDTLADEYDSFDAVCVDTNQWIYPRLATHHDIERGYRHQTLHDVMAYKHRERGRIAAHEAQCEKQGVPMRVTTVTGEADAPHAKPAVELAPPTEEAGSPEE